MAFVVHDVFNQEEDIIAAETDQWTILYILGLSIAKRMSNKTSAVPDFICRKLSVPCRYSSFVDARLYIICQLITKNNIKARQLSSRRISLQEG